MLLLFIELLRSGILTNYNKIQICIKYVTDFIFGNRLLCSNRKEILFCVFTSLEYRVFKFIQENI